MNEIVLEAKITKDVLAHIGLNLRQGHFIVKDSKR